MVSVLTCWPPGEQSGAPATAAEQRRRLRLCGPMLAPLPLWAGTGVGAAASAGGRQRWHHATVEGSSMGCRERCIRLNCAPGRTVSPLTLCTPSFHTHTQHPAPRPQDIPPNQTIYVHNLYEKLNKQGEARHWGPLQSARVGTGLCCLGRDATPRVASSWRAPYSIEGPGQIDVPLSAHVTWPTCHVPPWRGPAPSQPVPHRPAPHPSARVAELKKCLHAMFSQFGKILDVVALKTYRMRGQVRAGGAGAKPPARPAERASGAGHASRAASRLRRSAVEYSLRAGGTGAAAARVCCHVCVDATPVLCCRAPAPLPPCLRRQCTRSLMLRARRPAPALRHAPVQAWVVFADVAAATNALRSMQGFSFFDKPIVSGARGLDFGTHILRDAGCLPARPIVFRQGSFRPPRAPDRIHVRSNSCALRLAAG